MTKLFLWLNIVFFFIGIGGAYYIITQTSPTENNPIFMWFLLISIILIVWSIATLVGYYMRLFVARYIFKNKNIDYILIRSERQGLLLGILFGLQLALQGFLLFNILSATIFIIAIVLLEFFFIAQESK